MHDIEALDAAFHAKLANAGQSTVPASVAVPAQVAAIVANAPAAPTVVIPTAPAPVVNAAPTANVGFLDKIEAGLENLVKGKDEVTIGPLHFKV